MFNFHHSTFTYVHHMQYGQILKAKTTYETQATSTEEHE